jgi:hypothetical protein
MSINFKDLPPNGMVQMAQKVGINLHPMDVIVHDAHQSDLSNHTGLQNQPIQGNSMMQGGV